MMDDDGRSMGKRRDCIPIETPRTTVIVTTELKVSTCGRAVSSCGLKMGIGIPAKNERFRTEFKRGKR